MSDQSRFAVKTVYAKKGVDASRGGWLGDGLTARLAAGSLLPGSGERQLRLQILPSSGPPVFNEIIGSADVTVNGAMPSPPQQSQAALNPVNMPLGQLRSGSFVLSFTDDAQPNHLLADGSIDLQLDLGTTSLPLQADDVAPEWTAPPRMSLTQLNVWELGLRKYEPGVGILFLHASGMGPQQFYTLGQVDISAAGQGRLQTGSRALPPGKTVDQGALRQVEYCIWLNKDSGAADDYLLAGSVRCSWTIGGLDLITKDLRRERSGPRRKRD